MGMETTLEQVTPQQLAEFLEHPKKAYDYWLADALDNPNLGPFLDKLAEQVKTLPPGFREQVEQVTGKMYSKMQERKGLHLVPKDRSRSRSANDFPWRKTGMFYITP
jgi:hypothetical protein